MVLDAGSLVGLVGDPDAAGPDPFAPDAEPVGNEVTQVPARDDRHLDTVRFDWLDANSHRYRGPYRLLDGRVSLILFATGDLTGSHEGLAIGGDVRAAVDRAMVLDEATGRGDR
jgi:hypothetical protein